MRITIVYDNESSRNDLKADWGFSCLVETFGKKILFDTGASGKILLENMQKFQIDLKTIDEIFISHNHWDHIDGLEEVLRIHPITVYAPLSCKDSKFASNMIIIDMPTTLHESIYSTGEINQIEQSLVIKTDKGLVIIVGCAHSKVENILDIASQFGKPYALIGGLHDFEDLDLLKDLEIICPTHCTEKIDEIKKMYPDKYISGGVGTVIEIS